MAIITVSLPDMLIKKIDEYKESSGFMSRSEVIRDALKTYFTQEELKRNGHVLATILVLSDASHKGTSELMLKILHENRKLIINFNHMHVEGFCVDSLTCLGESSKISEIIREIRRLKGVIAVRETMVPMEGRALKQ